jgi:hypothetical protein
VEIQLITHTLSVLGGSLGTLIFNYFRSRSQDKLDSKKIDLQQDQQAFLMYKDIVDRLNNDVLRMQGEIKELTIAHNECIMTKEQQTLLDKLSTAMLKLRNDGDIELAEKLKGVVDAIADEHYVLALIIAQIQALPKKVVGAIQQTYNVREIR